MKILIFTGYIPNINNIKINQEKYDFVIAADKGYEYALQINVYPDLIIGDFDTAKFPTCTFKKTELITLPPEKDMTDTEAALDIAATKQPSSITILGGLGGRFDHTMGNIALLSKYDIPIKIKDEKNSVTLLRPGKYFVAKAEYKYLSLVPYSPAVSGLSIRGVKYPLEDAELTHNNTLGISNEIIATSPNASPYEPLTSNDTPCEAYSNNDSICDSFTNITSPFGANQNIASPACEISFKTGKLLVCQSND